MARVIFVNRFGWPDETATAQLMTDLTEALAGRGHEVLVVVSRPADTVPAEEVRHGVRLVRVGGTRWDRGGWRQKAADFGTYYWSAYHWLRRQLRRGDTVVTLTDPPLIGIGTGRAARRHQARVIHWVQDIYPEIAITASGRCQLGWLRPWRNAAWRAADACVTLGADMAGVIAGGGVPSARVHVIPNWAPRGLRPISSEQAAGLRADWGLTGKFVVAYSGNLGRVQDLGAALAALALLRDDPRIVLVVVGGGARQAEVEAAARRLGLAQVQFRPYQPRARLGETLAVGDLHLVTLRPGYEHYVFPSKLYGVAAVGRPVLYLGPRGSEPGRMIESAGFGFAFAPEESEAIADKIRELAGDPEQLRRLGARAIPFAAGGFDRAINQWEGLLR